MNPWWVTVIAAAAAAGGATIGVFIAALAAATKDRK
jgi:hypothetical protein